MNRASRQIKVSCMEMEDMEVIAHRSGGWKLRLLILVKFEVPIRNLNGVSSRQIYELGFQGSGLY